MAVLQVIYYPDAPLTQKAQAIATFGPSLQKLVQDLFETMRSHEGVGLAAPQVGKSIRLFVLQEPDGLEMCLVNPEIIESEGSEEAEEGCLSMPQVYAMVPRATKIRVKAQDPGGDPLDFEATDFLARIIQHEYDHLEGILFPERLDIITRQEKLEEWAELREQLLAGAGKEDVDDAS